jgi:kynurenine formamidase
MPVHVHFLVDRGIHIMECLNLEGLAAARVYEFLFIAAPLKIRGATGSPIRPLAVENPGTDGTFSGFLESTAKIPVQMDPR